MRRILLVVAAGLVGAAAWGCKGQEPAATRPAAAGSAAAAPATSPSAAVAGRWEGKATIVVNWVKQRDLPVRLDIGDDGTVSGTVGDAKLVNATLNGRAFLQSRDYRVHGQLQGNLIEAEQVQRDAVDIVFDRTDQGLSGGLHSSGSEFGGKETMKLSASGMVLRPQKAQ